MGIVSCRGKAAAGEGSALRWLGNSNGPLYLWERPLLEEPRGRAEGRDKRMSMDVAAGEVWEGWRGNLIRISQQRVPQRCPQERNYPDI